MNKVHSKDLQHRKWSFIAANPEVAMIAMEREMLRLGWRVLTHEMVVPNGINRFTVHSIIVGI